MFWYIDPSHTAVNFSVKHMMVTTVRGSLGKVRGRIELDPEYPEKGDFEISATVKGISTGDVVNNLSAMVGEPNVFIHEAKIFVCQVAKG